MRTLRRAPRDPVGTAGKISGLLGLSQMQIHQVPSEREQAGGTHRREVRELRQGHGPEDGPVRRISRLLGVPAMQDDQEGGLSLAIRRFLLTLKIERNYSPATARAYGIDLKNFLHFATERKLTVSECDRMFVRSYLSHIRRQPLSRSSLLRKWASLRSFFKYPVREEIIPANPCLTLPTRRR